MSIPKGALIGKSRTAEVYEWGEDKLLKLYFNWVLIEWIQYEAKFGSIIYKAGVSSPAVHEIIDIEGRTGIIFQPMAGKSMLERPVFLELIEANGSLAFKK